MIKFWKSAAKGKSGCPVRPPEISNEEPISATGHIQDAQSLLETIDEEEVGDYCLVFNKKSKLSLSLYEILEEKKTLKYFVQFMETIGKYHLVKCWLELDDFKTKLKKINTSNEVPQHLKITRAKSFDVNCTCKSYTSQRYSWRDKSDTSDNGSNATLTRSDCSTSSCGNLAEHMDHTSNCEIHNKNKSLSPTEEAISIFKKYVALEAPNHLDLPDSLRKSVISNICNPEGWIKEDCFQPIQDALFNQIEIGFFNDFMNSPFYIKAQIDIITSSSLNLDDILYNESILFYFTEYLEQENCSVYLELLMAVMHFRDNLMNESTSSPNEVQADAIVLYDKYFSLQATNPVGFPTEIRLKIESDICREGGPLLTCFDLPYRVVYKTLTRYVKTFLESELYYRYLSEMVHSVDQTWSANHKSASDCSSEFSISTQNTLLAMGDPIFRKKKRNHSVPDMTIDSNQLYNADALWQRKKHDGLSLGRVNSLGRFESKFEPDPDKKDKSVLKKMVSRFVPTTTSKVEEEMAWQIAHMIVKDVTDLTMAPLENEND